MRLASICLILSAFLLVAAIAVLGGASMVPLAAGAGLAAFAGAILRKGGRLGAWLAFLVSLVLTIGAAGFAGGAAGLASLVFWTLLATTTFAAISLFGMLWRAPASA